MEQKEMRAANLYAPGDLRVEQVPVPGPGPGQVLIKVRACGVCGSDIARVMVKGTYSFPTIPGHEFSGEVVELGPEAEGVRVRDRVTVVPLIPCGVCPYCRLGEYQLCQDYGYLGSRTDGAFAEYVVAPAANLLPLPEGVSFEEGAMTDPAAVALHAMKKLGLKAGDTVVIFGVGPIGAFALQWAKILGAGTTIAVDIFPEKLEVVRQLGADATVDSTREDPVEKIMDLTGGRGVERAVEFAGHPTPQEQSLLVAAKLGSVVWGGISNTELPLGKKAVDGILRKELTLIGSWNSSFTPLDNDWQKALYFMGRGQLAGEELVTHRLPLEQIARGFAMMQAREEYFNKVLCIPDL